MPSDDRARLHPSPEDCLAGGGDMGARMRSTDWSRTPFGPVAQWPQSLRTAVSMMLESRFAMVVAWGPEFRFFYNDRYRPVLGGKHPAALGAAGADIFPEVWSAVGPEFERVARGGAFDFDDWLLPLDRNGYLENCWFSVSYSPIRDESGGVGGVLAIVAETTGRVEGERRLATLRDLARRAADATTPDEACANAAAVFATNAIDVPFALTYLLDEGGAVARRVASVGLPPDHPANVDRVDLAADGGGAWPLGDVIRAGAPIVVADLPARMPPLPGGPYDEPSHTAIVLPLSRPGLDHPYGVLVAGVSPRRALDDRYRDFYELAADHIATAISNAVTLESARRRAEALAAIDRAKTAFFSNVSHEFRTPLTLMLGPVDNLLAGRHGTLTDPQRADVEILQRNAGRLLKLVNALLDFSRLEAGRAQASYCRTDVAALTRDLAGAFRSAIEHAGLRFDVDCEPIADAVFLDRDMWEKIVLNLLSNALKFTFHGGIRVALAPAGDAVELTVQDTGTGIPEAELPRIFDRFHRVEGALARTHEGTGIGLALTHELVRLHGGTITAESRVDEGTRFTVRIPTGSAHLPQEHLVDERPLPPRTAGAAPFVEEAARWLPDPPPPAARREGAGLPERILVVDDNADMRDYLRQLLGGWDVETAANGLDALARVRANPPALIVTDIMMPVLDGFALLDEVRRDPRTQAIPVLMLSARAGEEARVSGLAAGADDYIVKPFGARELITRVESLLKLSRARAAAEVANRAKDQFLAILGHELRNPLAPILTALQLMKLRGDESVLKERTVIDRQVRHLVRLVDDLLDVSRIARGKIDLRQHAIDLAELVAAAVEAVSPMLEERHHRLEVDVPRGLVLRGDTTRLTQVVVNVLSNAAKYTEPRGHIRVAARQDGPEIELRVKDTGIGIAAETLPRIFDMFTQERQAPDRSLGGLGLGLTIVKSLVELHGGSIRAVSDGVGRGSEFIIRLPAAAAAADAAPGLSDSGQILAASRTRRRVLVVDDNVDAARMMADALDVVGHETRVAFDGPGALDAAAAFRPEAALLDLGLPLMDGYELAQQLLADTGAPRPILVALTGYGQASDQERTRAAGFDAHMVKPVDMPQLIALLERLMAGEPAGPAGIGDTHGDPAASV